MSHSSRTSTEAACHDCQVDAHDKHICPNGGWGIIGSHNYNIHVTSITYACVCGSIMGRYQSKAPANVDPFGECPLSESMVADTGYDERPVIRAHPMAPKILKLEPPRAPSDEEKIAHLIEHPAAFAVSVDRLQVYRLEDGRYVVNGLKVEEEIFDNSLAAAKHFIRQRNAERLGFDYEILEDF